MHYAASNLKLLPNLQLELVTTTHDDLEGRFWMPPCVAYWNIGTAELYCLGCIISESVTLPVYLLPEDLKFVHSWEFVHRILRHGTSYWSSQVLAVHVFTGFLFRFRVVEPLLQLEFSALRFIQEQRRNNFSDMAACDLSVCHRDN